MKAVLSLCALLAAASAASPKTPHIIHIIADDLGYNDLGCRNGNKTHTPTIDSLIQGGISLRDYYTFKICAPSRAATMTGRYPWGVGYYDMTDDQNHCASNYTMLPELLRNNGYATHALGKWDVGMIQKKCTPTYNGFDTFLGYYTACTANYWYHTSPYDTKCNSDMALDFSSSSGNTIGAAPPAVNGSYDRNVFSSRAADIIRNHTQAAGDRPLYLYVAFHNVHDACTSDRYKNGLQAPKASVDLYATTTLDTWKVQAAMTTELDHGVKEIVDALKEAGMWNDSIIAFMSDNGGPLDHTANAPLRGGKATQWEGGYRVEAFMYSELFPSERRGSNYTGMMHSSDWYATFVEGVAGGAIPPETGPRKPDSHNVWDAVFHDQESPRTEIIHLVSNSYFSKGSAIRVGKYKLVRGGTNQDVVKAWPEPASEPVPFGKTTGYIEKGTDHCYASLLKGDAAASGDRKCEPACLFDLEADPQETHDLSGDKAYADIVANLTAKLDAAGREGPPPAYLGPNASDTYNILCEGQRQHGVLEPMDWP